MKAIKIMGYDAKSLPPADELRAILEAEAVRVEEEMGMPVEFVIEAPPPMPDPAKFAPIKNSHREADWRLKRMGKGK